MSGKVYPWQEINADGAAAGACGSARLLCKGDAVHGAAPLARFVLEHAAKLNGDSYWFVLMDADMRLVQDAPTLLFSKPVKHPGRVESKVQKQAYSLCAVMGNGCYAVVHYCNPLAVSEHAKKVAWSEAFTNQYAVEDATNPCTGGQYSPHCLFIYDVVVMDGNGAYISFREAGLEDFERGVSMAVAVE